MVVPLRRYIVYPADFDAVWAEGSLCIVHPAKYFVLRAGYRTCIVRLAVRFTTHLIDDASRSDDGAVRSQWREA